MQRTLILIGVSVAISIGLSVLVATLVKLAPYVAGRVGEGDPEKVVEEAEP